MLSIIPRESRTTHCLFQENGHIADAPWKEIYRRFDIDGVIRIHMKDYAEFSADNFFTHFNLQISHHIPGHTYALPKIIMPGFFVSSDNEQLPVLDFSQCFIARCINVREQIMYEYLTPEDFRYSFKHIQSANDLKKEILWRYKQSLPNLSEEEILSPGVSVTNLEILRTTN